MGKAIERAKQRSMSGAGRAVMGPGDESKQHGCNRGREESFRISGEGEASHRAGCTRASSTMPFNPASPHTGIVSCPGSALGMQRDADQTHQTSFMPSIPSYTLYTPSLYFPQANVQVTAAIMKWRCTIGTPLKHRSGSKEAWSFSWFNCRWTLWSQATHLPSLCLGFPSR